jgi:hypothetical protein
MTSIGGDLRRAARQTSYEIHEILEGDPVLDLGVRCVTWEYLDAVDEAMDYLEECDPRRTGEVSGIDIVRVDGDERETVWRYRHEPERSDQDLVERWGFHPTQTWYRPGYAA